MDESHNNIATKIHTSHQNTFERRQYCIGYTTKISITPTNLVNVNFIGPGLHFNLGPQLLNAKSSFDKIRCISTTPIWNN